LAPDRRSLVAGPHALVIPTLPAPACGRQGRRSGPTFSSAPLYGASGLSPCCHPDRSEPVFSSARFLRAGSRSGGIVARPQLHPGRRLHAPSFRLPAVGGNGVRAARYGFASHVFCAMNPPSPFSSLRTLRLLCSLCNPFSFFVFHHVHRLSVNSAAPL